MANLLEKFKNVRFPNWMHSTNAQQPFIKNIQAANDNQKESEHPCDNMVASLKYALIHGEIFISPDFADAKSRDMSAFLLRLKGKNDPLLKEILQNPLRIKLSAKTKRKLRKDRQKYKLVKKWLADAEKKVNEDLSGGFGNGC